MKSKFSIEVVDPATLLKDKETIRHIGKLVANAFIVNHDIVSKKFLTSTKQEEFRTLFESQALDVFEVVNDVKEKHPVSGKPDPFGGIIIVARDTSVEGQPIVGFITGVRNGNRLPSEKYVNEVKASDCGLMESIGESFSLVMNHYDMAAMDKYDNLFMVGASAVDTKYVRKGVATAMIRELYSQLQKGKYDGMFTILATESTLRLAPKLARINKADKEAELLVLHKGEKNNHQFIGYALNAKGKNTFLEMNRTCKKVSDFAMNVTKEGSSPLHSPRGNNNDNQYNKDKKETRSFELN